MKPRDAQIKLTARPKVRNNINPLTGFGGDFFLAINLYDLKRLFLFVTIYIMNTKIYIAADHAGFVLKEELKPYLKEMGFDVEDFGNSVLDQTDDYPDFIILAAEAVAKNSGSLGIVIGGSGQGEAIVANKVKGIRAAVIYDEYSARMSRMDNDANVASFGARTMDSEKAKELIKIWIETPFSNEERHMRRIEKIDNLI